MVLEVTRVQSRERGRLDALERRMDLVMVVDHVALGGAYTRLFRPC